MLQGGYTGHGAQWGAVSERTLCIFLAEWGLFRRPLQEKDQGGL